MTDTSTDQAAPDVEANAAPPETTPPDTESPVVPPPEETGGPVVSPADQVFRSNVILPGSPEASPDGAWIAYLLEDQDGQAHLWLSPTDGGVARRVDLPFEPVEERDPDTGRGLRGPQWSPDGATLALTGKHPDGDRLAIWLVPSPVAAPTTEPVAAAEDDAANPAESDAETLEGVASDGGTDDVTVAQAEENPVTGEAVDDGTETPTREPRLLVNSAGSDRSPRWSPDGALIAFVSNRDRRDLIALASPAGDQPGRAELLTSSAQDDREPSWSRDGRFLAFTRQKNDGPEHADILVFILETGELKNLTTEKTSAVRHSLDWVPGRNLVAYVTRENDWQSISVINADNKAGWTVTRESGDKTDPRFAPKEPRLTYVRSEGFATVCCERGLHASGAIALDPGEGVVFAPRWLAEKRVVYGFTAPQKPFGFLAQDNLADAERTPIPMPAEISTAGAALRHPIPFEFEVGEDEQFSGMYYATDGVAGEVPGIVYLPDGPLRTRTGEFQIEEQALASTGLAVFTPVLHGASGFGFAVEQDLADFADTELEISDVAEAGHGLGASSDVDAGKIALVGHGFGGTLALLTAGARPGIFSAVVAVDPITDWSTELESADGTWRHWVTRQYGLPRTNPDRYALRTPATFGAVIDVPLILISTNAASRQRREQLDAFMAYLTESGVAFDHVDAGDDPIGTILRSVSKKLAEQYLDGRQSVEIVTGLRADEIG